MFAAGLSQASPPGCDADTVRSTGSLLEVKGVAKTMEAIIDNLKAERAALLSGLAKIEAALATLTGETTAAAPVRAAAGTAAPARRRRRKMTDEQKRAISARMKKSWAARKRRAARQ